MPHETEMDMEMPDNRVSTKTNIILIQNNVQKSNGLMFILGIFKNC